MAHAAAHCRHDPTGIVFTLADIPRLACFFFRLQVRAAAVHWNLNSTEKPPHCYATLIYMAIRAANKDKITLGEIYSFVKDNFSYYRHNDNGWKNSIRHNLTQHSCFKKVQRNDQHPGKGGFWQLSEDYATMFKDGIFKRKRRKIPMSQAQHYMASMKYPMNSVKQAGKPAGKTNTKNKKQFSKLKTTAKQIKTEQLNSYAVLGDKHDMFDGDMGMMEGIDWETFIPDVPQDMPDMNGGTIMESPLEGSSSSASSDIMINALSNMDNACSTGSPMAILPDINQNDGNPMEPQCEEYTLTGLHAAPYLGSGDVGGLHAELSPDLDGVQGDLAFDCGMSAMSDNGLKNVKPRHWRNDPLCVVGKTMKVEFSPEIKLEGIVPNIERDVSAAGSPLNVHYYGAWSA